MEKNGNDLIIQSNDKLTLNKEALKNLPNYKNVVDKLESIQSGESIRLIKEINEQLAKLSQKIIDEQGKLKKMLNLAGFDIGRSEREEKLRVIANNYSRELQNIFNNFDNNNYFAGTDLILQISGLGNNPNLTKIADFTKKQEQKSIKIGLGNLIKYSRGVMPETQQAIEDATK